MPKRENKPRRNKDGRRAVRYPASIVVTIDELVLEGFAPFDKYAIGEAVQAELERLLAHMTWNSEQTAPRPRGVVDAGVFRMGGAEQDGVGAQVAARIADAVAGKPAEHK
jgi:hypothetical protein